MIIKCPCCGYIQVTGVTEIRDLAEEALNDACLRIQNAVGQGDGGLASHVFSDNVVRDKLQAYILTEIQHANEEAAENIDAGRHARHATRIK